MCANFTEHESKLEYRFNFIAKKYCITEFFSYIYCRSTEDGNCLYNSVALLLNCCPETPQVLRLLTVHQLNCMKKASFYARLILEHYE